MKHIALIILCLYIASCQNNEPNKSPILAEKNDNYSYQVFESDLKYDEEGNLQCEKYLKVENNKDGFKVIGADLKNLVSILLRVPKENVVVGYKEKNFISITYEGEEDSIVRGKILERILNRNHLQIAKREPILDFKKVVVLDTLKLNSFLSEEGKNSLSKVSFNNNEGVLTNVNLKIYATVLNSNFSENIIYKGEDAEKYNFEVNSSSFDENYKLLKSYGLSLKDIRQQTTKYYIEKNQLD